MEENSQSLSGILKTIFLFLDGQNFKQTCDMLLKEAMCMGLPEITSSVAQILVLRPSTTEIVKVASVDPNCPDYQAQVDFPIPHEDRSYVLESSVCAISDRSGFDDQNYEMDEEMYQEGSSGYVPESAPIFRETSSAPTLPSSSHHQMSSAPILPSSSQHSYREPQVQISSKTSVATLDNTRNEIEDEVILKTAVSEEIKRESNSYLPEAKVSGVKSEYSDSDGLGTSKSTIASSGSEHRTVEKTPSNTSDSVKTSKHSILKRSEQSVAAKSSTDLRIADKSISTTGIKSDHKSVTAQPDVVEKSCSAKSIKSENKSSGANKNAKSITFADSMVECEIGERSEFVTLDFNALKKELRRATPDKQVLLLQALRWRITKSKPETRNNIMTSYTRHDILGLHENPSLSRKSLVTECFASKTCIPNSAQQEGMARLVNTIASLSLGRDYLCHEEAFIADLFVPLLIGTHPSKVKLENPTRDFMLVTLQKMSLRNKMRKIMISTGIVEYLISFLLANHKNLSDYAVEYTTALLMNLCLHKQARDIAKKKSKDVVKLMLDFIQHDHDASMPYMNGAMYSLLTEPEIKKEAKKENLQKKIEEKKNSADEEIKQQLEIILNILTSDKQNTPCIDCDCIDQDEEVDHLENELNDGDKVTGEPNGEKLLEQFKRVEGKVPLINFLSCLCRPVTPLRKISANETCPGQVGGGAVCPERQKSIESEIIPTCSGGSLQASPTKSTCDAHTQEPKSKPCAKICKRKPRGGSCSPCKRKSDKPHKEKSKPKDKHHKEKCPAKEQQEKQKKSSSSHKMKDSPYRDQHSPHKVKETCSSSSSLQNQSPEAKRSAGKLEPPCVCDDVGPKKGTPDRKDTRTPDRKDIRSKSEENKRAGEKTHPKDEKDKKNIFSKKPEKMPPPSFTRANITGGLSNFSESRAARAPPPCPPQYGCYNYPVCYRPPPCQQPQQQRQSVCPPMSRYSCECYAQMKACVNENAKNTNSYRCQCGRQNESTDQVITDSFKSKLDFLAPFCFDINDVSEFVLCECYDNVFQSRPKVSRTP